MNPTRRSTDSAPSSWLLAILSLVTLSPSTACATSQPGAASGVHDIESRISRLEQEETERLARLSALDTKIVAAQAELDTARKEVDMYRCSARRARIRAEITGFRAQCVKKQAEYESCVASNSAASAKGAAFGCIAGLGIALITGGAAAPATLAGCGAGLVTGKSSNKYCGNPPQCVQLFNNIEQKMVGKHRLHTLPNCPWNGMARPPGTKKNTKHRRNRRGSALTPRIGSKP